LRYKLLPLLFIVLSVVVTASQMAGMSEAGAAVAYGFDAVLNNPAALAKQNERLLGGSYTFYGQTKVVLGYLEPGLSDLYKPEISNFRLAGGLTWLRDLGTAAENQYYYTVVFCSNPVYGGVNLIYKRGTEISYGMDLAVGADWFDRLTTAVVVKDIMTWTGVKNAPIASSPLVRLALAYKINDPLTISFDTAATADKKANFSLGGAYTTNSFAFRGGLLVDSSFKKYIPSLGFSYLGKHGTRGSYSLDLSLRYQDKKIGHSAGFSYSFF